MNHRRKTAGRRTAAIVCAALFSSGLILPSITQTPMIKKVRAEEIKEKTEKLLQTGDYVKGEALVFERDSEMTADFSGSDELLSQAEEIFEVETGTDRPEKTLSASEAERKKEEPVKTKGTIKLVKSSTRSTKELIETLLEDPRVVYAEPNYILDESSEEKNMDRLETLIQKVSSENEAAENDSSCHKAQEDEKSCKNGDEPVNEEAKNEETASDPADASEPEGDQQNLLKDRLQKKEAEDQKLTPSNFGPSAYTPGQIPDMTGWQWANWNNGSMAGTYTHSGTVDMQYSEWKSQTREEMPEYVIGVLDTGIDETNPDLAEVLWTEKAFDAGGDSHGCNMSSMVDGTSTTGLTDEHGTHVAGIIAGQWNGQGISGTASNVKLMSLRYNKNFGSILACLSYAKEAVKQGVNLIAINNSWGTGSNASNLVNLAVAELGELGVVCVFASCNDSANTDQALEVGSALANNPYAIVVNALNPNGTKADYSNYGIQTTDVMAPGSAILSTVLNQDKELTFLGEVNAHAPEGSEARENLASYTSFDDQSVNPFESFAVYTDEDGSSWGSELIDPLVKPAAGAFDGTGVLSINTRDDAYAAIASSVMDLSGLKTKPRYISCRLRNERSDLSAGVNEVKIPVIYALQDGSAVKEYKAIAFPKAFRLSPGNYAGFAFDLSKAETLTEKEEREGMRGCYINWEEFSVILKAYSNSMNGLTPGTIYFDSIALGSCRYPFNYMQGTSMAAPAAVGVLSVIAGQHADSLGEPHTPAFAQKLAALVKGAAIPMAEYEPFCATGGFVSVEGANNPGPAISVIEDKQNTFTLSGYYMDQASVTLDGISCSYTAESMENDRYVLTVQKPDGYRGGTPVIAVQGPNGKMDRRIVQISEASGKEEPGLFDHASIPLPDGLGSWQNYDVTGYNGRIYIYCRQNDAFTNNSNSLFAYDPESGSWDEIQIPLEKLTLDGSQVLSDAADVTACVKDGKLMLLLSGKSSSNQMVSVLASMDPEGHFEALGSQVSITQIPMFATLSSDGSDLYLAGGVNQAGPEEYSRLVSNKISKLTCSDSKQIAVEPIGEMTVPRAAARVSCSNGEMVITGGFRALFGPAVAEDADRFVIGQKKAGKIDLKSQINDLPKLEFSSGGLTDGTFLLTGPASPEGNTDTYILSQDSALTEFDKRACSASLLKPASIAYNNAYWVLATIVP